MHPLQLDLFMPSDSCGAAETRHKFSQKYSGKMRRVRHTVTILSPLLDGSILCGAIAWSDR
ncbi:hypothetical protein AGABI2DRAFT_194506 [Agaricus bisporus var. bisporus H97]|uniref:hypothetical protein n=1 Tax=Agaricus bisporus var. bisporus (strain H97 / ATCC MYA-4626 / FGSC 10389) TaxID=936046 RepID=UPI00029F7385|nr:hypothetical protein AGABI2DRAFT_194506 [Agaricus bisporus var. bisporus H97]EKV44481.1 hypothetical protein AGABI2DRAFT_194506 [Agaricus bisporus var. bisporus H97]